MSTLGHCECFTRKKTTVTFEFFEFKKTTIYMHFFEFFFLKYYIIGVKIRVIIG